MIKRIGFMRNYSMYLINFVRMFKHKSRERRYFQTNIGMRVYVKLLKLSLCVN
jgi:hypothetical protein